MSEASKDDDEAMWSYPVEATAWVQKIVDEFHIHPVTAQVLMARGFVRLDQIHDYLYAKLPHLFDPGLFPDMGKAVDRILKARADREKILIYGDNDVDGITGTTLLTEFLSFIGCVVYPYISNRLALTQNLLLDALDYGQSKGCSLIITVDCGISSEEEIAAAVERGLDIVVTDHHEPTDHFSGTVATLNPKLKGSPYPNRDLTGVGVAFKLAHGITRRLIAISEFAFGEIDLKRYLDLVALGTIADMGVLLEENRILVRYGLMEMRQSKRVGLNNLCAVCEVSNANITPTEVASKIAPRLNSLGRIADPNKGVELLLIKEEDLGEKLAKELDLNNIERQKIERANAQDIEKYVLKHPEIFSHKAIVLHSDRWHPGVIPIITAKISKQYNRPIVVIAVEEGVGKGSIRTIPSFPILPVLKKQRDLLLSFGGHDYAAGLTILEENIAQFKEQFIRDADALIPDDAIRPRLQIDAHVDFNQLTFDFMESLSLLEPYGHGNPPPIFYADAIQAWPPKVVGKNHLKFYLEQQGRMLEGIGFNMASRRPTLLRAKEATLRIAFTPHINTFLNKASIQLQVRDCKILDPA